MGRYHKWMAAALVTLAMLPAVASAAMADSARDLLAAGRVDDAISALQARIHANGNDAEASNLLCRAYYSVERWDDAVSACENAIRVNAGNSEYQMWMGRAYGEKAQRANVFSQLGLAGKSRNSFEKAVQLDGKNVDARSDLAEFYMEAPGIVGGGTDKARAQADAANTYDPGVAHYIRGRLAENDKNETLAEQEYKSAVQSAKGQASQCDQWVNLALYYSKRKRWDDMDAAISKVADLGQGPSSGNLLEGATLLGRADRNLPLATQLVRRYLATKQGNEDHPLFRAHWVLGRLLEKQGDKDGARKEYEAALALARDFRPAKDSLNKLQGKG